MTFTVINPQIVRTSALIRVVLLVYIYNNIFIFVNQAALATVKVPASKRRGIWQDGVEEGSRPVFPRKSRDTRSAVEQGGSMMSASRLIRTGGQRNIRWPENGADSRSRRRPCRGRKPGSGKQGDWARIAGTIPGRIRAIIRPKAAAGNPERRSGLGVVLLPAPRLQKFRKHSLQESAHVTLGWSFQADQSNSSSGRL